ncbi:alcohol dehydrogenase, partial [Mycobacterium sp. ITM-2017-0098]
GSLEVVDLPSPRPDEGQLVLDVLRCGICGSDLHAKDDADELTGVFAEGGYHDFVRSDIPVVMGHEFCGVVAERGRKVGKQFTPGT